MDTLPTADQVAVAIIAAAREVDPAQWGALALQVAGGEQCLAGRHGYTALPRARAYAAKALRSEFDCGAVAIGTMLGFGTPGACISGIEFQLRNKSAKWWQPESLERVIAAVRATKESIKPADDVPALLPSRPVVKLSAGDGSYVSADRPVPSRRQISARDMLAEAVRNTAALPIRE